MKYYIQRELHEYGPYTLADLQRYVAQGSILMTDLTRSEGMTEWVPVSQVIGNIPVQVPVAAFPPPSDPGYGSPGTQYGGGSSYGSTQVPPDLHWALVLLLCVVTCGLFSWAWLIVEASYVQKVRDGSRALLFAILSCACFIIANFFNIFTSAMNPGMRSPVGGLLSLVGFVLYFVAVFTMKSGLEDHYNVDEPINLQLSGVMTFFFAIFYFQYHFSRIAQWKKSGVLQPQG